MSVQYKGKTKKVKKLKDGESFLDLSYKKITDISQIIGLEKLSELNSLNLSFNKITEIKGLETLSNLKRLYLEYNQISEIKGLENLTKLEYLSLNNNQIYELKGLKNLKYLTRLNLMDNKISELKGLEKIKNLKFLSLYSNPLDDWMKKNFGRGPYGHGVVEYCRKMMEGEDYNCSRVEELLNQTLNDLENIIKPQIPNLRRLSKKELLKINDTVAERVGGMLKKVHNLTLAYDFLGRLLSQNVQFFDAHFCNSYNSKIANKLSSELNLEMESYILEKYCFLEGEFIISKFLGSLTHGKYILSGRIHATNYRIIGHGAYKRKEGGDGPPNLVGLLLWAIIATVFYSTTKAIFNDVKKSMGKDLKYKELPIFGYQFPILNARKIKMKKQALLFKTDRTYKIEVTGLSKESKAEFGEDFEKALFPVYENIMENRKDKWEEK